MSKNYNYYTLNEKIKKEKDGRKKVFSHKINI